VAKSVTGAVELFIKLYDRALYPLPSADQRPGPRSMETRLRFRDIGDMTNQYAG
jgi:hypothetical protein